MTRWMILVSILNLSTCYQPPDVSTWSMSSNEGPMGAYESKEQCIANIPVMQKLGQTGLYCEYREFYGPCGDLECGP